MKSKEPIPFKVGDSVKDATNRASRRGVVRQIRVHLPVRIGVNWDQSPRFAWVRPKDLLKA